MKLVHIILDFVAFALLAIAVILINIKVNERQHQIDQLCSMALIMVRSQGVVDDEGNVGLRGDQHYDFQFADLKKGIAVLKVINPKVKNDNENHYVIIHDVSLQVLEHWTKYPHNIQ